MSFTDSNRELPPPTTETTLLIWLLDVLQPMNRTRVKQLLRAGRVAINSRPTTRHDHPLHPGDRVTIASESAIRIHNTNAKRDAIAAIYQDSALIAIDKPVGLLTVATEAEKFDTAFVLLKAHLAIQKAGRPFVVHRLDRETSGLLIFARSAEIRDYLQANWSRVTKTYLAVVEGQPSSREGTIENFLTEGRDLRVRVSNRPGPNAKRAETHYRVIATRGNYSLVEVELQTGRKHQIRVHMAGLGCPVIGDTVYAATMNPAGRLGLHAWRLALDHPLTGKRLELESPFPETLKQVVGLPGEG